MEHREAVEHDLLSQTGFQLDDVGRGLSWAALSSFISSIGPDTATAAELWPDVSEWATRVKTNAILADIYDVLSLINANLVAMGSHKPAKTPDKYPRPNDKNENTKHFGSDALPVEELHAWIEEKRREYAKRA